MRSAYDAGNGHAVGGDMLETVQKTLSSSISDISCFLSASSRLNGLVETSR